MENLWDVWRFLQKDPVLLERKPPWGNPSFSEEDSGHLWATLAPNVLVVETPPGEGEDSQNWDRLPLVTTPYLSLASNMTADPFILFQFCYL